MAKKPETKFSEKIRPQLEALPRTVVFKIQQRAIRGTPDYILCIGGAFVALELKKDEKQKPDQLQTWNIRRIIECGGGAVVVHPKNFDGIYKSLHDFATDQANDLRGVPRFC